MTTKQSHQLKPLSAEHIRWAVGAACRGLNRTDVALEGPAKPFSADDAFARLSMLGVHEGIRGFFSLVLEGGDDDAEHLCKFLSRFPKEEQRTAARALFRLIAWNAEEGKMDLELEKAFADCVKTAEAYMERGWGASLSFLKACSAGRFGAMRLSENVKAAENPDLAETASRMAELLDSDAAAEFFGAVFSIAERIQAGYRREGCIMQFNRICAAIVEMCPEEAHHMCEEISYSDWGEEGGLMMLMAVFSLDGVPALFTGADREKRTELANECAKLAASIEKAISQHCSEGVERLVVPCLKAQQMLSAESPRAAVQFSSIFNAKVSSGAKPEALLTALDCVASPETMETVRQLEGTPHALGKYIQFLLENKGVRN